MSKFDFSKLAKKWPSAIVFRSEIGKFTGGFISRGYLSNLDCAGKGPRERIRVGRQIAYPVEAVVAWLKKRETDL